MPRLAGCFLIRYDSEYGSAGHASFRPPVPGSPFGRGLGTLVSKSALGNDAHYFFVLIFIYLSSFRVQVDFVIILYHTAVSQFAGMKTRCLWHE